MNDKETDVVLTKAQLKQLDKHIEQQEKFVKSTQLTLALLNAYKRDTKNLIFISTELLEEIGQDPEYIAESFDELGALAAFGDHETPKRYLGFRGNGLFRVISSVKKKDQVSIDDLIKFVNEQDYEMI